MVDTMLEVDVSTYLVDDPIAKIDIATMAPGLEAVILERHAGGADGDAKRIWPLVMLEQWHRELVDARSTAVTEAAA